MENMAAGNKLLDSLTTTTSAPTLMPSIPTRFFPNTKPFQLRKNHVTFNTTPPNYTRNSLDSSKDIMGHTEPCLQESLLAKTEKDRLPRTASLSALVMVKHSRPTGMKEVILQLLNASSLFTRGSVVLQLVSSELDPHTREPKLSREAVLCLSKSKNFGSDHQIYEVQFTVDYNFGVPGAITVLNKYEKEFFLMNISFEGFVNFDCKSWIQPEEVNSSARVFFSNKAYLPYQTPAGLKKLRESELKELRGDGTGIRLVSDRIYDYDVYNDIGDPDKGIEHARPTLGGQENPHPRRCRTGHPPTNADRNAEIPASARAPVYVPRDEEFEESKSSYISARKLKALSGYLMFSLVPNLYSGVTNLKLEFPEPKNNSAAGPEKEVQDLGDHDHEFAQRVLAGINPLNIERLTIFPPRSKLDPSVYGPQESAIKEEHIISHLDGMSVQQAMDKNKLFILDYHDLYLPFLNQINALDERKSYATRTLFFLTSTGTLKPVAIELSLPKGELTASSKQVLTPPIDSTSNWLWQLAKAHVCTNDNGVHQLVNHWLRVHACMEPFILASHRQLSVMHPIFNLLKPHLRYTLRVNATARETLINAGGTIESFYTPGRYCMQLACFAYKNFWRFDQEGLPADLIRRGIAVPDTTLDHGLRLLIKDYPYANDGLLYWSAIENLVKTYVNYYYPEEVLIQDDNELQAWYREVIEVGHADHRFATWWPNLETRDDLINILTILIWIATADHAALNFGQYSRFAPSRPTLMRKFLPQENDPEYASFLSNPKEYFLSSLPSLDEGARFASVLSVISAHASDEQYIGQRDDLSCWFGEPEILEAFYRFSMEIKMIEQEIRERNSDLNLRNRYGVGIPPYELLIPSSGNGVTSRGVPNSITV